MALLKCALGFGLVIGLAGCATGVGPVEVVAGDGVRGQVMGGQQPVAGATIQLYGVGDGW